MSENAMAEAEDGSVATLVTADVPVQMDPRLQMIAAGRESGAVIGATTSTAPDEIGVVARVTDRDAWENLSEVRHGAAIPPVEDGAQDWIVTGRIPASRIEAVRNQPFLMSLKAAQPLHPALAQSVEETSARPDLLPVGTLSNGGAGVVIGIVDFGCDFAHRNFIAAGGKTRLLSIWNQGGATRPNSPLGYGREYSRADIDAALAQRDPYAALGYGPAPDTPQSTGSHGTHVMDIAAGNGGGSGVAGFAPQADLVFVDLAAWDIPWDSPDVVGSNFGDSIRLVEAVRYIFDKAGDRPCVVNLSLGTNGGPHDGTTPVEDGLDRMVNAAPNRAITIAASNSYSDGIHAAGTAVQDGTTDLTWSVAGAIGHKEFELWYDGSDRFDAELIAPGGTSLGVVAPGASASATGPSGTVQVFVANRLADPNNGDNVIGIFLDRTAPRGDWTLRLHGRQVNAGAFHAWIERNDRDQSKFKPPHDNSHTIGSISCGRTSIVVGSYDAHKPLRPISYFSSAGPTRDGRNKPEISAPGHAVVAARSRTRNGVVAKSGTSMAAPAVCGIVALMLGEAQARGIDLSIAQIRTILDGAVRRDPPAGTSWEDRYGVGRIDAAAAIAAVAALPPAAASNSQGRRSKRKAGSAKKKQGSGTTRGTARKARGDKR